MPREIFSLMRKEGLDAVLLFTTPERTDSSFVYFTGLRRVTGCLVILPSRMVVFVSPLEHGLAEEKSSVRDVRVMDDRFSAFLRALRGHVGMNLNYLSVNGLKRLRKTVKGRIVDASSLVNNVRMVKRTKEIEIVSDACRITDKVYDKVFRDGASFRTEIELKRAIEEMMREYKVVPSFDVIVASGKHSAIPHHQSTESRLRGMTVVDMGVRLKNYCSDETRTVCFGQPSEKERDVYHLVKGVQETCLQMVRDGEDYNVIHHYAAQKLGKEMIHTVGHGLGIDVHESPFVNKDGKRVLLQKGMVITIEPGQYHDGKFGVRIEDDVVVEKEKGRVLSKTTKELIVV